MGKKKVPYTTIVYIHPVAPAQTASTGLTPQPTVFPPQEQQPYMLHGGEETVEVEVEGKKIKGKIMGILGDKILIKDEKGRLYAISINVIEKKNVRVPLFA